MLPPNRDLPLRDHSHLDIHNDIRDSRSDHVALDDRLCPGCKKSAVTEHGGLVVAFGYVPRRTSTPTILISHLTANPFFMSIASNARSVAIK